MGICGADYGVCMASTLDSQPRYHEIVQGCIHHWLSLVYDGTRAWLKWASQIADSDHVRSGKRERESGARHGISTSNSRQVEKSVIRANAMIRVTHQKIHLIPLGRVATHRVHWRREL